MQRILSLPSHVLAGATLPSRVFAGAQLPPRPPSDPELVANLLESAGRDAEDAGRLGLSMLKKRAVERGARRWISECMIDRC